MPNTLPAPSTEAQQNSQALQELIKQHCKNQKGRISFKHFMQLALYAPGLGYYSAGNRKFGAEGDFVTAPEISPLFGQSLSYALERILKHFSNETKPYILELGAGTGKLAADILENLKMLPEKYYILEISADLIERQQNYLKSRLTPNLFNRIQWLNQLPSTPFAGVILANEVIDAMPVHYFKIEHNLSQEYYVRFNDTLSQFEFILDIPTPELNTALSGSSLNNIISEINTDLQPWLASLNDCLTQGIMIFIDYGFPEHEYYHPDRSMGTLMCHYRHRAHADVFSHIGLSDITAHVDFTALAEAAQAVGLAVNGFTTQAAYLLDNNLPEFSSQSDCPPYLISQQIQQLTSPQEMGELFKVMALSKNWGHPITGFQLRDHRHRL